MESLLENKIVVRERTTGEQFTVVARAYPKRVEGPGLQQEMRRTVATEEGYPVEMQDVGFLIMRGNETLYADAVK